MLFTPAERCSIARAVHIEALRLGIVPPRLDSNSDTWTAHLQSSRVTPASSKKIELPDQKRRPSKYVTPVIRKSLYDVSASFMSQTLVVAS